MDLDKFKNIYQNAGKEEIGRESMIKMITTAHPVLRSIKRQLIFESVVWAVFLIVYYDFFDGHTKPLLANVLLAAAVALVLVHNILGYRITANPVQAGNIKESLHRYLKRLRMYAFISVASRVTAIVAIMTFFFSVIEFSGSKFIALGFVVLIILIQFILLQRVWRSRISKISGIAKAFNDKEGI